MRIIRLGLFGLLAGIVAGGAGCGSQDKSPNSDSGYCETLEARQRDCGFIGVGKTSCVNYKDAPEPCETRCVADATCAGIGSVTCGQSNLAFDTCIARCIGLEPVTCPDGTELGGYRRCDGTADCNTTAGTSVDEQGCTMFGYKCRSVNQYVPFEKSCDGHVDCSDGSDEPPDCVTLRTCMSQAAVEIPVTPRMVCDGVAQCADGSDEGADCAPRMCGNR